MKVPIFPDPALTQYLTDLAKEQEDTNKNYLTKGSANHSVLLQSPSNSIYEVLVNDLGIVNTNLVLFSNSVLPTGLTVTESRDRAAFFGTVPNAAGIHWGYISGLTLSTAGSSAIFSVAPGVAVDKTNADLMCLTSACAKSTAAWSVGSGGGALDTGSIGSSAWYHVFLIKRLDTGAVDVLISLSLTAPTLPANYTLFRRIGSMVTLASVWLKFIQTGDEFLWDVPIASVSSFNLTTTSTLFQVSVPIGVSVLARGSGYWVSNVNALLTLQSPLAAIVVANTPSGHITAYNPSNGIGTGLDWSILTDTNAQIRAVAGTNSTNSLFLVVQGWVDRRGRDG
jgi:hypothetical protein